MQTILFICTGNTCRSGMAEGIARDIIAKKGLNQELRIISAGTAAWDGSPASPNAVHALQEDGIDISGHRSKAVNAGLLGEADLILTMTRGHKEQVAAFYPKVMDKLFTLYQYIDESGSSEADVADPFGQSLEVYKACASEIRSAIEKALEKFLHEE